MKKTLKTIIALCLTIAMLSSLFAGVTFAADTVAVEWYGFDALKVTAALGEGTFASPAPSFFPANATETDVVWSVSNESVATIDENGVLTFLTAGTINVTAKLVDSSAVVESSLKRNGTSYELTITPALLKAVPAEASFASAGKGKEIVIIGAQGPLEIVSSSNELAATAEVLDETTIQINSQAFGYSEITVTDGVSELVVPAVIGPVDMASSQATWNQIFPNAEAVEVNDPGYMQWWLECIPINKAASGINAGTGIIGYGQPLANTQNLTLAHAGNTTLDGLNKTYFRYIGDGYNYYTMSTGRGMTVAGVYQFLTIRAPKDGVVNIKPKVMSMTTNSTSDGSYIAVFKEDSDGNMTRMFPAESADDPKGTDANAILNVTRNWLWVYPAETRFGKFKVGDNYQNWNSGTQTASDVLGYDSQPYTLTQAHVDLRKEFEANGVSFEVEAGDIIRVAQHCGHEGNSDGMSFLPIFSYVEANVEGLLDSETTAEIVAGETATIRARLNPIGTQADITITPAYANGTVVTVEDYDYVPYSEGNIAEYGYVDITLGADEASRAGTGYYRMNYGNYTQLIAVTVAASASGDGTVEDDTPEAGVEVILGQGGSDDGEDEPGSGEGGEDEPGSGEGGDTPAFEFTFNAVPSGLTLSGHAFARRGFTYNWTHENTLSSAQDYTLMVFLAGGSTADIDISALPAVVKNEYEASASASGVSKNFNLTANSDFETTDTLDFFWFYGDYANLAKNGLYLAGSMLDVLKS